MAETRVDWWKLEIGKEYRIVAPGIGAVGTVINYPSWQVDITLENGADLTFHEEALDGNLVSFFTLEKSIPDQIKELPPGTVFRLKGGSSRFWVIRTIGGETKAYDSMGRVYDPTAFAASGVVIVKLLEDGD